MTTRKQLFEQLNELCGSKTVILGIGNVLKGDDGVGPLICQQLRNAKVCAEVIDAGAVPENYIQPVIKKAPQNLLIIDAIDFGAPPGTVSLFEAEKLNSFAFSTHTLSPHLFVDMICRQIDVNIYIVGIQPEQTQLGQSLSTQVDKTASSLVSFFSKIFPPAK